MKMIDYLLIHPQIDQHGGDQFIPLGMMKIGAWLEGRGFRVEYWDGRVHSLWSLIVLAGDTRQERNLPHVLVSSMSGTQHDNARALIKILAHYTKHRIFSIGGYATQGKQYTVTQVGTNSDGTNFQYRIMYDPARFDDQDPITENTVHFYQLFKPLLFTSFGCPNRCRFCTVNHEWKPLSLTQFEKELRTIRAAGHRYTSVEDPNFRWDHRIGGILKKYRMKWHCNMECRRITFGVVSGLRDSGCVSMEMGVESGSFARREFLKRHTCKNIKFHLINEWLRDAGISPMYSFMVGFPTETHSDMLETMQLIDELHAANKCARFSIYSYVPYPSPLQRKFPDYPTHDFDMAWHPTYWLCGLKFRKDNVKKNFKGWKRLLSLPFEVWAEIGWKLRILRFPKRLFEWILQLVKQQKRK